MDNKIDGSPERATSTTDSSSLHKSESEKYILDRVDHATVRRAVLKMDLTLLPVMTIFYLLSFLDRANIGNARVAGLQKSLHMTDRQYQIAVTTTYVPYILAELPANLLLRKIGPNYVMPTILTLWGIIVILQGFVTSFHGLVVARAFLGLMEGPMFPGIVLYLSGFYTRAELSLRIAYFFSAASLSGAFSGLLAAAIVNMNGVGNKPGWSWIFIIEGIFSVLVGVISFYLVPATPKDSRFLSEDQKQIITQRLERDRPFVNPLDKFSLSQVLSSLRSPQVIIIFIIYFMGGTNLYGLALFLPSIVNQLGFSPNHTQLLSVGPFAVGFVVTIFVAYLSDRFKSRSIPLAGICVLAVAGYSITLASTNKHLSYAALYLMVPGVYGPTPMVAAWLSNNSEPYYRRATSIALGFVATNTGGILSTWRYPSKEGPKFHKTTIMNLTFALSIMALTLLNALILIRSNKQKKLRRAEILAPYVTEKEPDGGLRAWVELGDEHPDFRYVL
ncbi:putative transporter C11D3.18C [Psilocybe cubensis]|uniref:Major facilitator superfamily (MFS) profile domain-containing protein n=2 Tax=Psilocybe cubensis TaxID=181762 RepID=A0A8H7XQ36_PSICU|nr:putative transporter C11D3.18C [Psilocybe cubensis]KAH9474603.1 putative transporter C11D3.18C [Psilocybe cubensis]